MKNVTVDDRWTLIKNTEHVLHSVKKREFTYQSVQRG